MSKKISFLILFLLGILIIPFIAQAGAPAIIQTMVSSAVSTALFIASGVVIILWLVTGILFLTAQGAPEKLNSAKKALYSAVAGTVIVIVAYYAMDLVGQAFGI